MSAAPEIIERSAVERHAELVAQLAAGAAAMCMALWYIRAGETYAVDGFKSFAAFLRSIGMSERTGRLYANSGPLFEELKRTGHDRMIGHVDVLRPVAFLLNPKKQDAEKQRRIIERQAVIVRTAAAVAKKGQEPFGESVVARVAEMNFGIKPRAKYLAELKAKRDAARAAPSSDDLRKMMRFRLDAAWAEVVAVLYENEIFLGSARVNGYGLVQELGQPRDWSPAFAQALEIMKDAEES